MLSFFFFFFFPFLYHHRLTRSTLDNVGNIILWTVIECDLGIIAGCMPVLRKLIKSLASDESSYARGGSKSNNIDLVTFGRIQGKHHPIHDTDIQVTVMGGEDNDRDSGHSGKDDSSSTKQMIRVMRTFNQSSTRGDEDAAIPGNMEKRV